MQLAFDVLFLFFLLFFLFVLFSILFALDCFITTTSYATDCTIVAQQMITEKNQIFRFFADIIINFHTGYILDSGEGDVILDLRKVRIHYLKTWFLIDLISTLPLDYILQVEYCYNYWQHCFFILY